MTQSNNILHELQQLNSSLAATVGKNPYSVPAGYFNTLASTLLSRVKAMEVFDVSEELTILSPQLSSCPKGVPYAVSAGYFENLEARIKAAIHAGKNFESAEEELNDISPLLRGLKRQIPFAVPDGYFESKDQEIRTPAKLVSFPRRKWMRYAAAAVITGLFIAAGFMLTRNEKTPGAKALAGFTRDVKRMDEDQKDTLIDFIDAGLTGKETAKVNTDNRSNDVKKLLEGLSDEELKDLQEQTEDIQDVLMTNEP